MVVPQHLDGHDRRARVAADATGRRLDDLSERAFAEGVPENEAAAVELPIRVDFVGVLGLEVDLSFGLADDRRQPMLLDGHVRPGAELAALLIVG